MEFRRSGQRDERRRRVLIEESEAAAEHLDGAAASSQNATAANSTDGVRRYSEAAVAPGQLRVIDLIPTRWWTNFVLFGVIVACAAGIEVLYGYVALEYSSVRIGQLPSLDLAHRGSLATWFSSALLAASAVFGWIIYRLRRHRVDDYRGRYRMWCWIVPLLVLASIDQVAALQEAVHAVLVHHLRELPTSVDARLLSFGFLSLIIGAVGVRLLIEMRASRLACMLVLAAWSALVGVGCVQLGWLAMPDVVFRSMVVSALTMGAHVGLTMALLLYARHVFRDASGLVTPKQKRERAARGRSKHKKASSKEQEKSSETSGSRLTRKRSRQLRTEPARSSSKQAEPASDSSSERSSARRKTASNGATPSAPAKEKRRVAASAEADETAPKLGICDPDDDQLELDDSRKLSKSEKKRLRKQRRRTRAA